MAPPEKKHKRPVGAGLALDKFATLGVSKFDKRKKLERIQKQKLIQHSKYKKLKQKLEAQGILAGGPVKDSVAELEALDADVPSDSPDGSDGTLGDVGNNEERIQSHARAGPSSKQPKPPARDGDTGRTETAAAAPNGGRPGQGAPDVAVPAPKSRAQAASGQSGDVTGRHPPRPVDQQGPGDRKRPRGTSDETGPLEGTGRQKAPGRRGAGQDAGRGGIEGDDAGEGAGRRSSGKAASGGRAQEGPRGGKKLSQLQRLAQQVAEEKAEKQKAKEQAMKEREERMKKVAAVEQARKEQKHLHFKRNAKGQPLMRYRMEKLLSKIQETV